MLSLKKRTKPKEKEEVNVRSKKNYVYVKNVLKRVLSLSYNTAGYKTPTLLCCAGI